jgi:hypothetical protein
MIGFTQRSRDEIGRPSVCKEAIMKIVRRVVMYLSLAASVSGCTAPIAPNPKKPAPSGDVGDFAWAAALRP